MEFLLALAIVCLVAAFVTVPLRGRRASGAGAPDPDEAERADLEARRQVLYREIRDAEADHAAGKQSDEDFERLDRELRRDAVAVLKRLDKLEERRAADGDSLD
jgi:hypothetical protein